jgi:hypothetical protein
MVMLGDSWIDVEDVRNLDTRVMGVSLRLALSASRSCCNASISSCNAALRRKNGAMWADSMGA